MSLVHNLRTELFENSWLQGGHRLRYHMELTVGGAGGGSGLITAPLLKVKGDGAAGVGEGGIGSRWAGGHGAL